MQEERKIRLSESVTGELAMAQNSCPSPQVANNSEVIEDLPVMAMENKIPGVEQDGSVANVQCSKTDSSVVQGVAIIIQSDKVYNSDQNSTLNVKCNSDVLEKDVSNLNDQNGKEIAERKLDLSNQQSGRDYSAKTSNNDIERDKESAKNVDTPDVNKEVSPIECNGVKSDEPHSLEENPIQLEDEVSQHSDHELVLEKDSILDTPEHSNSLHLQDDSNVEIQDNLVTRKEPIQEKENSISSILGENFAQISDNLQWVSKEDLQKLLPKTSNLRLFRTKLRMNTYESDVRANQSVQEGSDEVTSRLSKRTTTGAQKRKTIWLENFKSSTNHPHSGSLASIFDDDRNKRGFPESSATRDRVDDEKSRRVPCNKSLPLNSNANNKSMKKDCLQSPVRKRRQITPKVAQNPVVKLSDLKGDHRLSNLNSSNARTSNASKHKCCTVRKRSLSRTKSLNTSMSRRLNENKNSIFSTSNNNHTSNSTASSNLRDCYVRLVDVTLSDSKPFSTLENARPGCSNSSNSISYTFQCENDKKYRRAEDIKLSDDEEEDEWYGWMSQINHMKGTGFSLISVLEKDGYCTRQLVSDSDDDESDEDQLECMGWETIPSFTLKEELEGAFLKHHNIVLDDNNT